MGLRPIRATADDLARTDAHQRYYSISAQRGWGELDYLISIFRRALCVPLTRFRRLLYRRSRGDDAFGLALADVRQSLECFAQVNVESRRGSRT